MRGSTIACGSAALSAVISGAGYQTAGLNPCPVPSELSRAVESERARRAEPCSLSQAFAEHVELRAQERSGAKRSEWQGGAVAVIGW
eukprot:Skav213971  [mRNA]  locus=scaffold2200:221973:226416:+ [translate_table: standard]